MKDRFISKHSFSGPVGYRYPPKSGSVRMTGERMKRFISKPSHDAPVGYTPIGDEKND